MKFLPSPDDFNL